MDEGDSARWRRARGRMAERCLVGERRELFGSVCRAVAVATARGHHVMGPVHVRADRQSGGRACGRGASIVSVPHRPRVVPLVPPAADGM